MRSETTAQTDRASGLKPAAPWRLAEIRVVGEWQIEVVFPDGRSGVVDFSRLIKGEKAGVFKALRDPSVFSEVRLESGAPTWPGEIDIAPDAIYEALKSDSLWIPE